jgi:hypothetical protein
MPVITILLSIFIACTEKSADTSTPISNEETGESAVADNSLTITNKSVESTDCGVDEVPDDILTVEVVEGVVQVLHENYEESSCLRFEVEGTLDGDVITVNYPKSGVECDCIDIYQFIYHIEGLEAGVYTLNTPGEASDSFTIE